MATSTVVVLRESVLKVGLFDEALQRCEDFDLWLRLAFQQSPMAYHTSTEVVHRLNLSGLSADAIAMKRDRIRVYEKVLATLPISAEQTSIIRESINGIQGELYLEQMKSALAVGDYDTAIRLAQKTSEIHNNWKVNCTRFFMRAAPRLVRQIFLYRARLIGDRPYPSAPLGSAIAAETDPRDDPRHPE